MYKAVKNGKIIDAYEQLQYVKYDQNAKMFLRCNKDDNPQGIIQRNGIRIYHVKDWDDMPKRSRGLRNCNSGRNNIQEYL